MSEYAIRTTDLEQANELLTMLVYQLRELRARGTSPDISLIVRSLVEEDSDPMVALARVSLLLSLSLQRLVDAAGDGH